MGRRLAMGACLAGPRTLELELELKLELELERRSPCWRGRGRARQVGWGNGGQSRWPVSW